LPVPFSRLAVGKGKQLATEQHKEAYNAASEKGVNSS
jgi:hypothetical protein